LVSDVELIDLNKVGKNSHLDHNWVKYRKQNQKGERYFTRYNQSNSEEEGGDNHAGGSSEGSSANELELSSFDVSGGSSDGAFGSPDILSIASFEVEISVIGLEEGESELSASVGTSIGSPRIKSIHSFFKDDIRISGGIFSDCFVGNGGLDHVEFSSA
jgi:hypothetical protein